MTKVAVYNQSGKEAGEMVLPAEMFAVPMNADLVHQVLISYTANARQVSAHTKNRGEVRGGGRKPWRQKGTGRARHGSTRSPIWVGGGVSGGPRNDKNYSRTIPLKMRRKAMYMVLSEKAKNNLVVVMDDMAMEKAKTKVMASLFEKLPVAGTSRLVAYDNANKNVYLAARNIAKTGVLQASDLNVADLLNYKYFLVSKAAIKEMQDTFKPKGVKEVKSKASKPKAKKTVKAKTK